MAKTEGFRALARVFFRICGYLGVKRGRYIAGGLVASLEMAQSLIMPYLYEQLVNVVTSGGEGGAVNAVLILLGALLLLTPLICWGTYNQLTAAAYATGELRKSLFAHIQKLPVSSAMEMKTGAYVTLMTSDTARAGGSLAGFAITSLFRFCVMFTASAVILFLRDWRMAVLSVAFSGVALWASVTLNPRGRKYDRQAQEFAAGTASFLIETVKGLPVIRVFLLKERFSARYRELCRGIQQRRIKYRAINGMIDGLIYLFQFSAQPVSFIFGAYLVTRGEMDVGSLVFLAGVAGVMADAVKSLSSFISFIQYGLVSGKRVFDLLDTPAEEERVTLAPPDVSAEVAVDIRDVHFAYPGGRSVFSGFSATVRRGEVVALVGTSGGGKSTLIKLIEDFYDVDSGDIILFGRSIKDLSRTDVRALSAYVPQDAAVFDGTILDNIALGKPGSTRAQVMDAAMKANIHDFIAALPQGYDTPVGERGTQISGGQRQRIAIARALLKDAPLLLLDEATSALDSEAEAEVIKALDTLMKGRTTIVVAHRLSTIQHADRILVLDGGSVAESGTHAQLVAENGVYAALNAKSAMA